MTAARKPLKPIYVQTVGRVRVLVWPRRRGGPGRDAVVSIERTQDSAAPSWYPSASFGMGDLLDLESVLSVVRAYLDGDSTPTADQHTETGTPSSPSGPPSNAQAVHDDPDKDHTRDEEPDESSNDQRETPAETAPEVACAPSAKLFPNVIAGLMALGLPFTAPAHAVRWPHRAHTRLRAHHRTLREISRS